MNQLLSSSYSISDILLTVIVIYSVQKFYNEYKNQQYWNNVFKIFDSTCQYLNTFCNIQHTTNTINQSSEITKIMKDILTIYKDINIEQSSRTSSTHLPDDINDTDNT